MANDRIKWAEKEKEIAISLLDADDNQYDDGLRERVKGSVELVTRLFGELNNAVNNNEAIESLTMRMLESLTKGIPLTCLNTDGVEWESLDTAYPMFPGYKMFRNVRYKQLFKIVSEDTNKIKYSDNKRAIISVKFLNTGDVVKYHHNIADTLIDELIPIEFPYKPENERYVLIGERFRVFCDDDDIDYTRITGLFDEKIGKLFHLERYFRETQDMVDEITKEKYYEERRKL